MRVLKNLVLVWLLTFSAAVIADNGFGYVEGVEYKKVPEPQSIAPYRKQVQEIFYYGCPHCYHLEDSLEAWKKTKSPSVHFEQVPAVLNNPNWIFMARVFYTAKNLGIEAPFHRAYFDAVQRDKKRIFDVDALAKFCEPMGIKAEDYKAMFNSFKVQQDVQRAKRLTEAYGIEGVPAVVINGEYHSDVGMAGSRDKLWKLVDSLTQ